MRISPGDPSNLTKTMTKRASPLDLELLLRHANTAGGLGSSVRCSEFIFPRIPAGN